MPTSWGPAWSTTEGATGLDQGQARARILRVVLSLRAGQLRAQLGGQLSLL